MPPKELSLLGIKKRRLLFLAAKANMESSTGMESELVRRSRFSPPSLLPPLFLLPPNSAMPLSWLFQMRLQTGAATIIHNVGRCRCCFDFCLLPPPRIVLLSYDRITLTLASIHVVRNVQLLHHLQQLQQ